MALFELGFAYGIHDRDDQYPRSQERAPDMAGETELCAPPWALAPFPPLISAYWLPWDLGKQFCSVRKTEGRAGREGALFWELGF